MGLISLKQFQMATSADTNFAFQIILLLLSLQKFADRSTGFDIMKLSPNTALKCLQ